MADMAFGISIMHYVRACGRNEIMGSYVVDLKPEKSNVYATAKNLKKKERMVCECTCVDVHSRCHLTAPLSQLQ